MIDAAKNGIVKLRKATVRTNSVPKCPNAEVPAVVVFYQSKERYHGPDSFTLEVKGESGKPSLHRFDVTVAEMVQVQ